MHDYDSFRRLENKGLENKYEKILNLPSWYGIVNVKEGKLIIQLPSFCLAIFICRTRHSNRVAGVFLRELFHPNAKPKYRETNIKPPVS